jgi:hypothetical protein
MEINKIMLTENLNKHFTKEFLDSLEETELDEEEKAANLVLARKKIKCDSENIADLVFKVME